jgi:hypothetical protein
MKYLKKFENFDLESYSEPEENWNDEMDNMDETGEMEEMEDDSDFFPGDGEEEITEGLTAKQKKLPKALQDAILKKQGKKPKKDDEDEDEKEDKKKSKKEDKEEEDDKSKKGLTAAQKKLPKALQDAILKKQKK